MVVSRSVVGAAFAVLALAPVARAQMPADLPIPKYVVDLRLAHLSLPTSDALASPYGLTGANLPGSGTAVDVGGHVYPARWRFVTFGVGLDVTKGQGKAGPVVATDGTITGTNVTAHFTAISPQFSLNFGSAAGWSYISGGLGVSTLSFDLADGSSPLTAARRSTINYGAGGRWFLRERVAFSLDLRFYSVGKGTATDMVAESPHLNMTVLSAGVSFR